MSSVCDVLLFVLVSSVGYVLIDNYRMQVQSEDITVAWGQQPHQLDAQYGRWRLAVFQDVQESIDSFKLYFLYDPEADERSGTTGARKGGASIVVFDLNLRCFVREIPITVYGKPKFLFALKAPAQSGGSSFVLVCEAGHEGSYQLHFTRVDLWQAGLVVADNRPILSAPVHVAGEYICTLREDAPELVVMANPGLQVWRIDAMASTPGNATHYFQVPGAELSHFYDGFLSMGSVYLMSAFADGNLDYSRVHVLSLDNPGQINTHTCHADASRGMPPARQQAAISSVSGYVLVAGGEINYNGDVQRLVDYWVLDLTSFQWTQVPASMPIPLIEPRLTTTYSGNIYLWGDFDQPLPGMVGGTHLRVLRVTGFGQKTAPPSYDATSVSGAPYPTGGGGGGAYPAQPAAPYPQTMPAHPPAGQQHAPAYPSYAPNQAAGYGAPGGYPQAAAYGTQPAPAYGQDPAAGYQPPPGQHAYYPPQEKKKKDCVVM